MSARRATPLFIDTSAFFAWFHPKASRHSDAKKVFEGIVSNSDYRPLYTSRYILSELATLMLRKSGHKDAVKALSSIRQGASFEILSVDSSAFDTACDKFKQYDDQRISFVDHTSAVLCQEHDISHVLSFDSDFRTLGFRLIPEDTDEI
ncbi:MAG: PIN domain-containing protein [Halobacteria archaeon]|nr:PIN domain-containing protein [Halobacteria archaeon]